MYVRPVRDRSSGLLPHVLDLLESRMVATAGKDSDNLMPGSGEPRVTVPQLEQGGVRIALSVLYSALEEFVPGSGWTRVLGDFPRRYREIRRHAPAAPSAGAVASAALAGLAAADPPHPRAFPRLLRRLENVERHVGAHHSDRAGFAHDPAELETILSEGRVALVHCVEGAFHLGSDAADVEQAVRELARRGVAYITLGHLFHRRVATVAPAIPYLSDDGYHHLFPQPDEGLTHRARAAIATMVEEGVLLDISHLSGPAIEEAFTLIDEVDPDRTAPVIASHTATRIGSQAYNLDDVTIERVASRRGVVGLILAQHQLADGTSGLSGLELLFRHVDRIAAVTGGHAHTAIGSDLGGFIKPIDGVSSAASLLEVREALEGRYGADDADSISGGNARRLLTSAWRRGRSS